MTVKALHLAGLIAWLALAVAPAGAQKLYAIDDTSRNLISIDPVTLTVTTIGATGIGAGNFGDLAYDSATGKLYWVAGRGNDSLYTIDTSTGAATLVGSHGVDDLFTLGFDGTSLYGQSTSGLVYRIDGSTGAATAIGSNAVYPGGYDYNSATGEMVLLEAGWGGLYSVDLTNGAVTVLNTGAGLVNDNDVAYDAGQNAYWAADWSGNLFKYDAGTYARTAMLSGLGCVASLAYVPGTQSVPEPGPLAVLVGLAVPAAAFLRRRR